MVSQPDCGPEPAHESPSQVRAPHGLSPDCLPASARMRRAWRSSNPRSPDRPLNTNSDGADDDESDSRYLISCRAPSPSTGRRRSSPARTTPTTNPSNCGSQLAAIQRNPTASPSCRPLKASTPTRARSRSPWLSSLPARATIPTSSWGPMVGEGGRGGEQAAITRVVSATGGRASRELDPPTNSSGSLYQCECSTRFPDRLVLRRDAHVESLCAALDRQSYDVGVTGVPLSIGVYEIEEPTYDLRHGLVVWSRCSLISCQALAAQAPGMSGCWISDGNEDPMRF